MAFMQEHTSLYKTAFSDLQGAWQNLRNEVVAHHPFHDSARLLFQIDEGMSWEAVRDLDYMKKILLVVRNIAMQAKVPTEVDECITSVASNLEDVFEAMAEGKLS